MVIYYKIVTKYINIRNKNLKNTPMYHIDVFLILNSKPIYIPYLNDFYKRISIFCPNIGLTERSNIRASASPEF